MQQLEIFAETSPAPQHRKAAAAPAPAMRLEDIFASIRKHSDRPRLNYHILTLLASLSRPGMRYRADVVLPEGTVPVREHLAQLLVDLTAKPLEETPPSDLKKRRAEMTEDQRRESMLRSRKQVVSRAMNELVKAGLVEIIYRGHTTDSRHNGGGREADYRIKREVLRALPVAPTALI